MAESTPPSRSLAGSSVAGYDVVEELGAGGMGVVYRAVGRKLGRSVALKVLPATSGTDASVRERFLREARAASALDHPNIGTIFGVEELPVIGLCIVMAFYEGRTLAERIARQRLSPAETMRIAIQVAEGLAAAHAAGIIHRDVKPSNIMLTSTGLVKVVDFGLAKLASGGDKSLTKTETVVGTVAYMSPEQARGLALDARTDVWSVGVMLYECAGGRLPFSGPNRFAQLYSVVHDEPPPLPNVYAGLEATIRKSLEKDVAKRFASMQELADELRRIAHVLELSDAQETRSMGAVSAAGIVAGGMVTPRKPVPDTGHKVRRAALLVAVGLAAIGVLVAGAVLIPRLQHRHAEAQGKTVAADVHTTLAILPLSGADGEVSALAGGLAQRLSARLTRLETFRDSLTVLSSADLLARKISDGEQASRKLGATLFVSGTLSRVGTSQQLVLEIRDRRRTQPDTLTVESADIGVLEDRAVDAVAGVLEMQTSPQVSAALWRTGTSVAAAYEPYLRGMGYLQRWDKAANLDQARAEFSRAAAVDPQFALAQAGLAEAAFAAYTAGKDPSELQAALGYSRTAIQLDSTLAEAHVVLGRIYRGMTQQRDLALIEFRRALELDPRNSEAIQGMARVYEELGRDSDAEAAFKRGVALRPWGWSEYNGLASYYLRKKRYADAEAQYRKALVVTPDNAAVYSNLGSTLLAEHKPAEAVEMYRHSIALEQDYRVLSNLAALYYDQRDYREAAETYGKALDLNRKNFIVWGSRGQALLHGGAPRAEAENALRHAIALGEEQLRLNPDDVEKITLLAMYQAQLGEKAAAQTLLTEALTRSTVTGTAADYSAIAYELIGDRANAVRWAQKALDTGYSWTDLKADIEMDQLVRSSNLRHSP